MGLAAVLQPTEAELLYAHLMAGAARRGNGRGKGRGNDHALACVYASWCTGAGALPDWLGLTPEDCYALMRCHFPGASLRAPPRRGRHLPTDRLDELADLVQLLSRHRAGVARAELWIARIVGAACLANDHLWQDLGLWSREDLSALMQRNFPSLAARNVQDMKWKRFLYRQLCEAEGLRLCRSPSCAECCDYHVCFGPED